MVVVSFFFTYFAELNAKSSIDFLITPLWGSLEGAVNSKSLNSK